MAEKVLYVRRYPRGPEIPLAVADEKEAAATFAVAKADERKLALAEGRAEPEFVEKIKGK